MNKIHWYFIAGCMISIGCLNIHGTHVTANNSTNNNVVFILF